MHRLDEQEVATIREQGVVDDVPAADLSLHLVGAKAHLDDKGCAATQRPREPAQDGHLLTAREGLEHVVDEDGGVVCLDVIELRQVGDARDHAVGDAALARAAPGVGDDGRADVERGDGVARGRQPNRVEARAAGSIQDRRRRRRQEPEQAAHVAVDRTDAPAGAVVRLVEVLAEEPAADHRVTPVELHRAVECTRPRVQARRAAGHRRRDYRSAMRVRRSGPQNARS